VLFFGYFIFISVRLICRCLPGSPSSQQYECGNANVFCPAASTNITYITRGYYTNLGANALVRQEEIICPLGSYCIGGIKTDCPMGSYANDTGMTACLLCPAATYGSATNLGTSSCSGTCTAGYWYGLHIFQSSNVHL
jgi:hypothetical protein